MSDNEHQKNAVRPYFRELIKRARLQRGLTQTDVARACGLKPAYVSQLESGVRDPSVPVLDQWAASCGMQLLLATDDEPKPGLDPLRNELAARLRAIMPDLTPESVSLLAALIEHWKKSVTKCNE